MRARSSAGEHRLHTAGVAGSIPAAPTIYFNDLDEHALFHEEGIATTYARFQAIFPPYLSALCHPSSSDSASDWWTERRGYWAKGAGGFAC